MEALRCSVRIAWEAQTRKCCSFLRFSLLTRKKGRHHKMNASHETVPNGLKSVSIFSHPDCHA